MKRILTIVMCALIIMSVAACKKTEKAYSEPETATNQKNFSSEPEVGTEQKEEIIRTIQLITGSGETEKFAGDTYATIIRESHPVVYVYYGDENNFSELSEALEAYNKSEKDYLLKFMDENRDYAMESYLERGENFYEFESTVTPYVRRADTVVTSILYYGYEYLGGVHGNYYYYGKNYDTKMGKELLLSDVVNDKEKLVSAVLEQLDIHWSDAALDESADIEKLLNDETAISWTLDYNGITVYFMPYSIASYASGAQMVTVSNGEYPDVLKEEYKKTPVSYGVELANNAPFYYDVTGDGKVDEVIFSAYESDYEGTPGEVSFYINGDSSYSEEDWFYGAEATFVHTKNGKNYIYVESLRENDYRETACYDLSYGISRVDSVNGGLRRIYHEGEDNVITQDVLTNPESFYLCSTTQRLSTATGYKEYHIGENGVPESDDRMFVFDEENMLAFTMLTDLKASVCDMKSGELTGKEKTLKAGESVLYVGTDNEKYGYLKASDGTTVRVEVVFEKDKFGYTIDGVNTEEIFDGLFYAG